MIITNVRIIQTQYLNATACFIKQLLWYIEQHKGIRLKM